MPLDYSNKQKRYGFWTHRAYSVRGRLEFAENSGEQEKGSKQAHETKERAAFGLRGKAFLKRCHPSWYWGVRRTQVYKE